MWFHASRRVTTRLEVEVNRQSNKLKQTKVNQIPINFTADYISKFLLQSNWESNPDQQLLCRKF